MSSLRLVLIASAASIAVTLVSFGAGSRAVPSTPTAGAVKPTNPMLDPRSGHSATLLSNGKVLIVGGMRRNQDFYRSVELFDPVTSKFERAGEMALARVGHAAVLLSSGKVLVVGGWIGHGCTDSAELYDPGTQEFTVIGKMTARRGQPTATLLGNDDVLIAGGADHDAPGGIALAEVFHSASQTFEAVGSMHYGRISHTATLLNDGRVLVAGGRGDGVVGTSELYDPQTRKFVETGSLLSARYKHTAGLLPDGRVLIAGGSDDRDWNGTMSTAEIYDPRTGKFTATSPMADSRFKLPHEAPRLASGKLLIAGGSKHAEIYDAQTGTFAVASGELSGSWHFLSETRLKDGSVLLAGGYANNDKATPQAWIYRP